MGSPLTRRELLLAGTASVAVAGGYLVNAQAHGALGIARNDDWVYYRALYTLADTGQFVADPWTSAMLVGQTYLARPIVAALGAQPGPVQIAVTATAAFGLLLTYVLARSFLRPLGAAVTGGLVAGGPILGTVAVSFHTDAPAYTTSMATLVAGWLALRGVSVRWGWWIAALLSGMLAFSIREYAAAALLALGITALAVAGRFATRTRVALLGSLAATAVAVLALYRWRTTLPGTRAIPRGDFGPKMVELLLQTPLTLAMMLSPLVALLLYRLLRSRRGVMWLAVGVALTLTVRARLAGLELRLDNLVRPLGSYPTTVPAMTEPVLPPRLYRWIDRATLVAFATLAAAVGCAAQETVVRRRSRIRARPESSAPEADAQRSELTGRVLAATFLASVLLAVAGVAAFSTYAMDRYLLPAVPVAAALAWRWSTTPAPDEAALVTGYRRRVRQLAEAATVLALVVASSVGLHLVDSAATIDGLKWAAGRAVVNTGRAADTVDASYEWFGYHQTAPIVMRVPEDPDRPFWEYLFANPRVCARVHGAPTNPTESELVSVSARNAVGTTFTLVGVAAAC